MKEKAESTERATKDINVGNDFDLTAKNKCSTLKKKLKTERNDDAGAWNLSLDRST